MLGGISCYVCYNKPLYKNFFCFQTFVNVGVATGILPNTGMPFPFMSYGGSAMWVDMICIGIVLSVGMKKPKSMF